MKVQLFTNYTPRPKFHGKEIGTLVRKILREEKKNADSINVVLVDDGYLLEVNKKFLNHNYKTDVIAFDLGEGRNIEGEVYISVDRARTQARRYGVSLENEIMRLIAHGLLHLAGWDDASRAQKLNMRKRENLFIEWLYARRTKR
ncbi:MAG TPA: rRNA maturation RNase YbeY [Candidatus Kryptonia bacterium]